MGKLPGAGSGDGGGDGVKRGEKEFRRSGWDVLRGEASSSSSSDDDGDDEDEEDDRWPSSEEIKMTSPAGSGGGADGVRMIESRSRVGLF